jgi:hippurate hydrolase
MRKGPAFCLCLLVTASVAAVAATPNAFSDSDISRIYPDIEKVYLDLHQNPELSGHETRTAAKMAEGLRTLGFDVTEHVGGTGVVGVLKNGPGPVVLLRTELDALPVLEKTGLPYASHVTTHNDDNVEVPVMHACGHDVHMSSWLGTARLLSEHKDRWSGTLVMVGQPAEEAIGGAALMLKDGLYTRFPKPDVALAIHDDADLPAGQVGYNTGYTTSNADSINIMIYGRGGHGSAPHTTIDPIVIGSRIVLTLQTLVSRETRPGDFAVVTVGTFQAGTKNNIIPDEANLKLTVRSYDPEVRKRLLAGINRVVKAEAEAGGATKPPLVQSYESADAVYNAPAVADKVMAAVGGRLGSDNVKQTPPITASEDFSEYGRDHVPTFMMWVGATEPGRFEAAMKAGERLPSLHSSTFAPDRERTLKTAMAAESTMVLAMLGPGASNAAH